MDPCCHDESCAVPKAKAPAAIDDCCGAKADDLSSARGALRRVLWVVLALNAAMFVTELTAGLLVHSTALLADSADMFGDAFVYGLSLYALQRSDRWRAGAAVAKGGLIAVFGVVVLAEVAYKIGAGVEPMAGPIALFGSVALAVNVVCLALLYRYRQADINMSSSYECSRNDVLANGGVLLAALGVYLTASAWPDILVGLALAALFLRSSVRVLRQAWPQFRAGVLHTA